jgi:S1-C subfamily serine protease
MVQVERVNAQQPFGKAGLRPGDVVLSLNGTPVTATDSFRRLLRQWLAEEGAAVVRVRRGDKTVDLHVPRSH